MNHKGVDRVGDRSSERGASLVEFAIMAPLLILLLLGIVEFGWLFAQNVDIRHGAREASRLAATNYPSDIATETCSRMDLAGSGAVTVDLSRSGSEIGSTVTATVSLVPDSLTGFFDAILPSTLESSVQTRMEQTASWATGSSAC